MDAASPAPTDRTAWPRILVAVASWGALFGLLWGLHAAADFVGPLFIAINLFIAAWPVKTALLMSKNLRVQGLTVGSRAQQLAMIAGVEANGIRPILDQHFPLENLADAFRHQAANAHFGKIIVDI